MDGRKPIHKDRTFINNKTAHVLVQIVSSLSLQFRSPQWTRGIKKQGHRRGTGKVI